jgi:hypothetical protein
MLRKITISFAPLSFLLFVACWSHKEQFHTTVINQTGNALHSIEIDYPGGTYGIANLAAGASNHKWVFANGPCHYAVRFVDEHGKQYSPKPIDISKNACPPGITLTIDPAMNVTAAATPQ